MLILRFYTMEITSPAFKHEENIPKKYTCDGEDISPPLKFHDIPNETRSLVLIADDPDAPNPPFVHWTVWNIDSNTKNVEEDVVFNESVVEGMTDFGNTGYGGPCPPSGIHRYFFRLYALDEMIDLDASSKKQELEKEIEGKILDSAELVGKYKRK